MNSCLVIAEVGQAHDGSLGQAHAFIDSAADAGADVIKFQTHIAKAESSLNEPWRIKFSLQDEYRFDYWKRMEFTEPQWHGLKKHADDRGIQFISSPFSLEAVKLLRRVGVAFWKVASGEVTNYPLLDAMAETKQLMLLSSGMSPLEELESTVNYLKQKGCQVAVMQCTTAYPCPPERIGLQLIPELRKRLNIPIGLSDHSGTIYAGLAAATLGAKYIEVHIVFHKKCFGPDTSSSITVDQLKTLVDGVGFIKASLNTPYDKDNQAINLKDLRAIFMKSICLSTSVQAGELLTIDNLTTKKPGSGIPASRMSDLVGKRAKHALDEGCMIKFSDIEDNLN